MKLVMGSLEREGVRVMWGCEPQQVRRVEGGGEAGEEGAALNVSWFSRDTGETHQV